MGESELRRGRSQWENQDTEELRLHRLDRTRIEDFLSTMVHLCFSMAPSMDVLPTAPGILCCMEKEHFLEMLKLAMGLQKAWHIFSTVNSMPKLILCYI
jgi:hypothetical protein